MSWTDGATRNFLSSLTIREDMVAHVEFIEEPETQSFGTKKNRKGDEVPDIRVRAKVTYLDGSAMYKEDKSFLKAQKGENYTLWIGSTLSGSFLDAFGWSRGDAVPAMVGTKWKVFRGDYGQGGHRVYEAELLSGDYSPISTPEVKINKPEPKPTPKPAPTPAPEAPAEKVEITDATYTELAEAVSKLGDIDKDTWAVFCKSKGVPLNQVDEVTETMISKGMLYADATKVSAEPIE